MCRPRRSGHGTVVVARPQPHGGWTRRGTFARGGIEVRMGTLEQKAELYAKFARHAGARLGSPSNRRSRRTDVWTLNPPALARGGHPLAGRSGIHTWPTCVPWHPRRHAHLAHRRAVVDHAPCGRLQPQAFVVTQGHTSPPSRGQIAEGHGRFFAPSLQQKARP